ncbi:MAG: FtsX-like permease family protein [Candidatus Latescibacterota bacterium]
MIRSLLHYWRVNMAVALAGAVATAALTGALVVGDSMRGSLRALTLERLGDVEHVMLSPRYFRQELADELLDHQSSAPALLLAGSAVNADRGARAGKVQIVGVDVRFADLFATGDPQPLQAAATSVAALRDFVATGVSARFPRVLLNQTLADELSATAGDDVLLSLRRAGDMPAESLFGRRGSEDVVQTLRCRVAGVLPSRGPGRFALQAQQSAPRTVFFELAQLQRSLNIGRRINTILIGQRADATTTDPQSVRQAIDERLTLADLGLVLHPRQDLLKLESERFVISPPLAAKVTEVAASLGLPFLRASVYLVNRVEVDGRSIPYSTIAALEALPAPAWGVQSLRLQDEHQAVLPISGDDLYLNDWAMRDLGAEVGDPVILHYFEVGPREEFIERQARFRLRGSVAMTGFGADSDLTPRYPGIQEARDMADWSAPFPVDLDRVRPEDERYWDMYGAAPKVFIAGATGQRLWGNRYGDLTSLYLASPEDEDPTQLEDRFASALLAATGSAVAGYQLVPVRASGLAASTGATDFGGLFIGFSLFLIAAAAILTGLMFRLGTEQRAAEIGLLLATGHSPARVRRRLLSEALLLAVIGSAVGLVAAVGYGWLMMAGLGTWWQAAVGTSALRLHVEGLTLLIGFCLSLLVVVLSLFLTLRKLGRASVRTLLAGVVEATIGARGKLVRRIPHVAGIAGLSCVALAGLTDPAPATRALLFFAAGGLLLTAGLTATAGWLRLSASPSQPAGSLLRMAALNTTRNPGRSITAISLVACACFVIVVVGAQRRGDLAAELGDHPGTGDFAVVAEADVPIYGDLNDRGVRLDLGISGSDATSLASARIYQLRMLPGEDVSCLNLYRPERPRLLGVPDEFVTRGGFSFAQSLQSATNPWRLLQMDLGPDVVPAIADFNSAQWILHVGLGDEILVAAHDGRQLRLRLVALLDRSIFQSEIMISEEAFERHFPDWSGYRFLLAEASTAGADAVVGALEHGLGDYGLDATLAGERMASFLEVENTYLSTFQTLGGLGFLLGSLGLGLLLLRNALERRKELAVLQACGFARRRLLLLLFWETTLLLLFGSALGGITAVITAIPHVGADVPWSSLAITLAAILGVASLSNAFAVLLALHTPLLPALKGERA